LKYFYFIAIIFFLVTFLTACLSSKVNESSKPGESSSTDSLRPEISGNTPSVSRPDFSADFISYTNTILDTGVSPAKTSEVSSSEIKEAYDEFTTLISSLKAYEINELELTIGFPKEKNYITKDVSLISKWVNLLKQMKITTKPFQDISGRGYGLYIYTDKGQQYIGGFVGKYLYNSTTRTMYIIDNYNKLLQEFESLEKQTGYDRYIAN